MQDQEESETAYQTPYGNLAAPFEGETHSSSGLLAVMFSLAALVLALIAIVMVQHVHSTTIVKTVQVSHTAPVKPAVVLVCSGNLTGHRVTLRCKP
jgi:hypothetical protein